MQGIPGTEMIGPGTVGHRDSSGNRNQRDVQALNITQKMPVGNRRSTGFPYYVNTLVIGFGTVMGFNKVLLHFRAIGAMHPAIPPQGVPDQGVLPSCRTKARTYHRCTWISCATRILLSGS